ncbi:MAG: O-antigen ligase family protein [Candidatus Krumholzibacteriia bacterium]
MGDPRAVSRFFSFGGFLVVASLSLGVSHFLVTRIGLEMFTVALAMVFFGTLYAVVSFRNLMVPLMVWILTIGGFRFLWSIRTSLLPDLFLDRIMLVWVLGVFMIKFMAEKKKFRGPFTLDLVMLTFASYLLVRVYLGDMEFLNPWVQSVLIPYSAYFFAKNIIQTRRQIHTFLLILLILTVYYSITAVAEKFTITWLIWPKTILTEKRGFIGRSGGPFQQAALFGTILGILIPLHLYFLAKVRNSFAKILLFLSLGLGIAGLYFTYTRGSWLAGVVALLAVGACNPRQYLRYLVPVLFIAPIAAIGFLGASQDKFLKERVENEDTLGSRVGTAATALRIFRDNPVLGVGYFQFREAREDYIQPVEVPGLGTIRFVQFRHNHIHDIYLGPLAENGLVGAFLQGWIYYLILRIFLSKFRWRTRGDPVAIYVFPVFAGIFVGYLVGGLAFDYRFFSFMDTLFYASAGILNGYQGQEQLDVS